MVGWGWERTWSIPNSSRHLHVSAQRVLAAATSPFVARMKRKGVTPGPNFGFVLDDGVDTDEVVGVVGDAGVGGVLPVLVLVPLGVVIVAFGTEVKLAEE